MPYLMRCPACAKDVSTDAKRCPHCGRNIESYLKAKQANAPHEAKISKSARKACLTIFITIIVTLFFIAISTFFMIEASSASEMHSIAQEISPEHYDGHYQSTANTFMTLSVVFWFVTLIIGGVLTFISISITKKQSEIIKKEKSLLVSEDKFR